MYPDLNDFIARVRPFYSATKVNEFARSMRVHPGIVVGQLQRREEVPYSNHRRLLAPVRDHVLETAVVDGWGRRARTG